MTKGEFALVSLAFVVVVFLVMWLGWRARSKRGAMVSTSTAAPVGAVIAEFPRVFYVSTTPVGEPLTRVNVPGLTFRGKADVQVRADGVTIAVDGEHPVHLSDAQLVGATTASRRVGKAVEHDGLALIVWEDGGRDLESSFRLNSSKEQQRFLAAVEQISPELQEEAMY